MRIFGFSQKQKNMRLTQFLTLVLFFAFSNLFSQSTFQSFFGEGIPFTEAYDIINTEDGGFLVTGNTNTNGNICLLYTSPSPRDS